MSYRPQHPSAEPSPALESGQELYPGCRLALVNPEPGENKG